MGQEGSSIYYSPSTTPGGYPFYFTGGTQPPPRQLSLPVKSRSSSGAMAQVAGNTTAASMAENTTVAGPEYRHSSTSEESNSRSIPPPSKFKIYYATPEVENRDFDGWENKLCFPLPISDIGTCCTATWIPCYLFGKSNWRLEQLREHKNPSNKSYQLGQGCNIWCWAWVSLQAFQCGCKIMFQRSSIPSDVVNKQHVGVGTGFQRNRVRATYGIKGTCFNDFMTAYFCNCCVLMQTDREIQAREGRTSFVTNKKFNLKENLKQEAAASQQQSMPMQQMRYQQGGDTNTPTPNTNVAVLPSSEKRNQKRSTPFPKEGSVPSHRNSKVGAAYRNAKSEPPHRKTSDFTWSDFSLFPKNKTSFAQSTHSPKDLDQSHSGIWSPKKKPSSLVDLEGVTKRATSDENTQPGVQTSGTNVKEPHLADFEQETLRRSSDATVKNWRHNSVKGLPKRSQAKTNVSHPWLRSFRLLLEAPPSLGWHVGRNVWKWLQHVTLLNSRSSSILICQGLTGQAN